jgi:hypothetical protein
MCGNQCGKTNQNTGRRLDEKEHVMDNTSSEGVDT